MEEDPGRQPIPTSERQHRPLPQGYRQGIITAITVLLGFSLAFFRFWGFEASGEWAPRSIIPAGTLAPSAVVIHHVSPPRYVLRVTLATCEGGTAIGWAQEFEDGAVADRIRHIVEPANEQNLNRLQAVLAEGES